ncbi:DNA-binding protein [Parabacteroides sp. AF17-28]|jgi:excisionase family DNA binding protein|nr:DNA-binding protein [Parabacteroides sp. AF17-28]
MTLENRMYSPLEVLDIAEQYAESKSKRLITETVRTTLRTIGVLKPTMNRSEAEREAGSRRKVANALRDGSLRCVKKGRNVIINRDDFESWLKENEFN